MKGWRWIVGEREVQITCADPVLLLNTLTDAGIDIKNTNFSDELVFRLTISNRDYKLLCAVSDKQGAAVESISKTGVYWTFKAIKKRPVLTGFIFLLLFLFCFLPTRVLFITVEGNTTIPTNQILEAASECGIGFGASRRRIRSEKMKNALLEKIPQLQWSGINTSGCTAIISVKEKSAAQTDEGTEKQVSSIIASRDGIIQNCTVYRGNSLCKVGQVVKAGQKLVSGYTDCGNYVQATRASAEIFALTSRELEVIAPSPAQMRGELVTKKVQYSIRIGKKLIKLTKDSGILGTGCAKIYSEEYVHLPGGYDLPVALVKQTYFIYEDKSQALTVAEDSSWLYSFAQSHLKSQMIAGQILSAQADVSDVDGAVYLYGCYACMEMIGQAQDEQMILKDGPND